MIWRPMSLSELSPIIFHIELTHEGSEASIYTCNFRKGDLNKFSIHILLYRIK